MLEIGKYNRLKVIDRIEFGAILEGDEGKRILLPNRYVPAHCKEGMFLKVFVYLDSEDRIVATTEKPYIQVGEVAYLKVKDNSAFGSFLDWGLAKDLLVPLREQKERMVVGRSYFVYAYLDERTQRIVATEKIGKYINQTTAEYAHGEEVDVMVEGENEVGYKLIVNNRHWGLCYYNQVYRNLSKGEKMKGYVREIRPDNRIDINLSPLGYNKIHSVAEDILDELSKNEGYLPINDKTPPQIIREAFGCSKNTFKMTLGSLYKERFITISPDGIRLIKQENENLREE
ncbi:MAG TPA: GntR family transcriptional regulator [Porphyromonadaceae bacterium]|nr:GntR family transcriptional regulator [Porphyromonadaceae bacterium]